MHAGLTAALELLKDIADETKGVGYADVFQLASATAIELAGGPKIPLRFGRKDAASEEDCVPEGRLPGALLCRAARQRYVASCCQPGGPTGREWASLSVFLSAEWWLHETKDLRSPRFR